MSSRTNDLIKTCLLRFKRRTPCGIGANKPTRSVALLNFVALLIGVGEKEKQELHTNEKDGEGRKIYNPYLNVVRGIKMVH